MKFARLQTMVCRSLKGLHRSEGQVWTGRNTGDSLQPLLFPVSRLRVPVSALQDLQAVASLLFLISSYFLTLSQYKHGPMVKLCFSSVLCGLCFASKGCYSPHPVKDRKYLMKNTEISHPEMLDLNRTISITHSYAENYAQHTVDQTSSMASLSASCTLPGWLIWLLSLS